MVKKYLIRIIGALCILGAVALMFMPGWLELDEVDKRSLRDMRSDISGTCTMVEDRFINRLEVDDDFKDDLKDCDLPASRGAIKSRFNDIEDLSDELLDDTVSLQELLTLSVKAPGLIKDAENLLDSDAADLFFAGAAEYTLFYSSQALEDEYSDEQKWSEEYDYYVDYDYEDYKADLTEDAAAQLSETAEETLEMASELSFVFILLAAVLILILVFGAASAILHVCNKGRWVKYLFLVLVVTLVAGSCVVIPMVSEALAATLSEMPAFEDMTLKMTATPFIAAVLTIVPIVLDIVFERKKEKTIPEEVNYGK